MIGTREGSIMGIIKKINTIIESVDMIGDGLVLNLVGKSVRSTKNGGYILRLGKEAINELLQYEHMEYTVDIPLSLARIKDPINPHESLYVRMKSQRNNNVEFILTVERLADLAEGANPVRSSGPPIVFEDIKDLDLLMKKRKKIYLILNDVHHESKIDMEKLLKGKQLIILFTA